MNRPAATRFIDELEDLGFKVDATYHASLRPLPNAVDMRDHIDRAYTALRDALQAARDHVRESE
ncbi:MAG: hypothetical protein LLG14_20400 [Nocardiaceae bacterium]|nr:hypothetical protein [Nocardiaceae bacterium]